MGASVSWQHRLVADLLPRLRGDRRRASLLRLPELLAHEARRPEAQLAGRHLSGLDLLRSEHRGSAVLTLEPRGAAPDAPVLVVVHGGGHVRGVTAAQLRWCAHLARTARARVSVPFCPTAPRATAEVVVAAAAAFVRRVLADNPRSRVTVLGESSGGAVALAALQVLASAGRALPDHLVLVSPWLDASVPGGGARRRDPLLHADQLRECGRLWAGGRSVHDPLVSPLHGHLRGLPPMTVFSSTRDLLHHDSLRLAGRAREQGVELHLDLRPGLVHGWAVHPRTPEGSQAAARISEVVTGRAEARPHAG